MTKAEIIQWLMPYLRSSENRSQVISLSRNPWLRLLSLEQIFQFFVVRILREHNYTVIVQMNEGRRSKFEQFLFKIMGCESGVSDLFVCGNKPSKGIWLELKSERKKAVTLKGEYIKDKHVQKQAAFIRSRINQGFEGFFLYPENMIEVFKILNIKIKGPN